MQPYVAAVGMLSSRAYVHTYTLTHIHIHTWQVPVQLKPQRPGDPPILYSDPSKIKFELGWRYAY